MQVNLGGDRLGSGSKNNISLHGYNRSTHDLSRAWRSSMTVGTLVPFMVEPALPGDSFSIDLATVVRTMPAVGPLYGSYKMQLDVFSCPIRLYNGLLHNNMTKIGLNMSQVKFPILSLEHTVYNRIIKAYQWDISQINPSALLSYLGIRGIAGAQMLATDNEKQITRDFNAIPVLAYYDIYKNYYANKQEEIGKIIKAELSAQFTQLFTYKLWEPDETIENKFNLVKHRFKEIDDSTLPAGVAITGDTYQELQEPIPMHPRFRFVVELPEYFDKRDVEIVGKFGGVDGAYSLVDVFEDYVFTEDNELSTAFVKSSMASTSNKIYGIGYTMSESITSMIKIQDFPLENIDLARTKILQATGLNNTVSINAWNMEPYKTLCQKDLLDQTTNKYIMNGLALKTYQSDLLNNWLKTEYLTNVGGTGINDITAIDVSSGSFTIDALNLANKVYNMLNRIAVSGGTYEDYIEAVYDTDALKRAETPIYVGGLSSEIVFEEVVSQSATEEQPLGSLAGKGSQSNIKGGNIEVNIKEPSFIIGIASITPRVDYSQGNKWFMTELQSMDDLHKPALDGIGFEDLLQERAAWWGSYFNINGDLQKMAMGKVPAWINYMTSLNETYGEFAEQNKLMFMTLNRQYESVLENVNSKTREGIKDLTTYINPTKYNYTFANTSIEAQNFWVQIGIKCIARRVMSAKIIPNL